MDTIALRSSSLPRTRDEWDSSGSLKGKEIEIERKREDEGESKRARERGRMRLTYKTHGKGTWNRRSDESVRFHRLILSPFAREESLEHKDRNSDRSLI